MLLKIVKKIVFVSSPVIFTAMAMFITMVLSLFAVRLLVALLSA